MSILNDKYWALLIMVSIIAFSCTRRQSSGLIAPDAELKEVKTGFTFTEGPAADSNGDIYFTDIPEQKIYKWTWADGAIELIRENTGEANGLMFDSKERLVVCEMGNNRVTRDDLNGNITVLADAYNGQKLHMPNDLWIDSKGGIYFSDFTGPDGADGEGLQVYYITRDGIVIQVTDDLKAPNGVIGTPDGKLLYVTDPGARKTWSFTINSDGSLSDKKLFCDQATDGMALDEKNNVYFSDGFIFSPEGELIEEIDLPQRGANLSFGGKDRKTLFITAMSSVYTLEMTVKGAPTPLDLALIAPGAELKTIGTTYMGTEGPATDPEGNIYFTDVFDEKIYKWNCNDGNVELIRENTGMANGMMFDHQGRLVICEMGNRRITRYDLNGELSIVADSINGKPLNNPNDLWIDPKGGIYFSHQYFPFTGGGPPPGPPPGEDGEMPEPPPPGEDGLPWAVPDSIDVSDLGILYISPDGNDVIRVTDGIKGPNGLYGTPDGKTLYVGDHGKVYSYSINEDGTLSNQKLFCEKRTDGMAIDERNNVYLTSGNYVLIYAPSGELLEEIEMQGGCSNVEFGGKDRQTLFITFRGYFYTLDMSVKGGLLPIDKAN